MRTEAIFRAAQERIKQYIVDNALRPGDPLPTEFDLSRSLGISRNSLREALKALETIGVVETRHGLGSFVGHALAPDSVVEMEDPLVKKAYLEQIEPYERQIDHLKHELLKTELENGSAARRLDDHAQVVLLVEGRQIVNQVDAVHGSGRSQGRTVARGSEPGLRRSARPGAF